MTGVECMEQFKLALDGGDTSSVDALSERILYEIEQEKKLKGKEGKIITWDNFNEIIEKVKNGNVGPQLTNLAYWITSQMACSLMYGSLWKGYLKRGKGLRSNEDPTKAKEDIEDYFASAGEAFYNLMDKYDPSKSRFPVYISYYIDGLSWKFNNDGSPYLASKYGIRVLGQEVLPSYDDEKVENPFEKVRDDRSPSVEEAFEDSVRQDSSKIFESVVYNRVVDPFWGTIEQRFDREAARDKIREIEKEANTKIANIDAQLKKDKRMAAKKGLSEAALEKELKDLDNQRNRIVTEIRNKARADACVLNKDAEQVAMDYAMAAVWEKFLGGVNNLPSPCRTAFVERVMELDKEINGLKEVVDVDIFTQNGTVEELSTIECSTNTPTGVGEELDIDLFADIDDEDNRELI